VTEEKEQYQLPEAPASINVRFYYHRFDVQATVRDETLAGAWEKLTWLIEKKLIPHTSVQPKFGNNSASSPEPKKEAPKASGPRAEGKPKQIPCPTHNVMADLRVNKQTGAQWYSHKLADGTWCNVDDEVPF